MFTTFYTVIISVDCFYLTRLAIVKCKKCVRAVITAWIKVYDDPDSVALLM